MSRGKKLDIFIGAEIEDGWSEVVSQTTTSIQTFKEPSKHLLHFKKERRRGKVVTLVGEFFLKKDDSQTILKKLKKSLGCGGTFKDGYMEFQGDIKESLKPLLKKYGFRLRA